MEERRPPSVPVACQRQIIVVPLHPDDDRAEAAQESSQAWRITSSRTDCHRSRRTKPSAAMRSVRLRSPAVGGSDHHHQPNDRNAVIKPYALRGPFGFVRWAGPRGGILSQILTIDIRGQRACRHHRVLATQEEERRR